jgi:hypothetical protein
VVIVLFLGGIALVKTTTPRAAHINKLSSVRHITRNAGRNLKGLKADSNVLAGVIDFHAHTGPDVEPRLVNDLQLVRLAKQAGMRAVVLKSHFMPTADRAELAMEEVGGIEVFGGIVLNRSVGGLNAEAVTRMLQLEGHRGKVVWLPTFDAEHIVRHSPGHRPYIAVVEDGKPVAGLGEIFKIIAQNNLILETGHSGPEESLVLIPAAKAAGVTRIVVTHAMALGATIEQVKQMAAMGAVIECCWYSYLKKPDPKTGIGPTENAAALDVCAKAIHVVGAEHFLISSDMGLKNYPLHTDAMKAFMVALKARGINSSEIDLMTRKNPAKLLGLEP